MENNGWISVNTKAPEQHLNVMLYMKTNMEQHEGYLSGNQWRISGRDYNFNVVTYWKDLDNIPQPKRLVWQYKTLQMYEWKDATDEDYEKGKHLMRFDWRRIEK